MTNGPDFICIGAQKAGTSWLHWNLMFHPQGALPPEKEMNYFYPPATRFWMWLLGRWYPGETGEWPRYYTKWKKAKRTNDPDFPLAWYKDYLFRPRTIDNYRALFWRPVWKISGDMSPFYAQMPEAIVKTVAMAAPYAKIIYLLRDPVARAWSEFKMKYPTLLGPEQSAQRMEKLRSENWVFSRYGYTLRNWEKHFPGRLRVWFYEEICEDPVGMFKEVCEYLGIEPLADFHHQKLRERIFEGPPTPMPEDVRRYLSDLFKEEIQGLHARFGNRYTQAWLEKLGG